MMKYVIAALAVTGLVAGCAPEEDADVEVNIEESAESVGEEMDEAADDMAEATEDAVEETGEAMDEAGEEIQETAEEAEESIRKLKLETLVAVAAVNVCCGKD